MISKQEPLKKLSEFKNKLVKSTKFWQTLMTVFPLTVLLLIITIYFLDWSNYINVVLNISIIIFFIICFIWWGWALYKIIEIAQYLSNIQKKFSSLRIEILKLKKDLLKDHSK